MSKFFTSWKLKLHQSLIWNSTVDLVLMNIRVILTSKHGGMSFDSWILYSFDGILCFDSCKKKRQMRFEGGKRRGDGDGGFEHE